MSAALGDAAWMTNMERNSDLVIMSAYAPLFVNVNPGGMQWPTDLIGYDALNSYGSPAYYAQKMFNNYHGDVILAVTAQGIPTRTWQPPAAGRRGGQAPAGASAGTQAAPPPVVTPPAPRTDAQKIRHETRQLDVRLLQQTLQLEQAHIKLSSFVSDLLGV